MARQVDAAQAELARGEARYWLGDYPAAREVLEPLAKRSGALGYDPLHAEVLYFLGHSLMQLADYEAAETTLTEAFHLGVASGADETAV